MATLIAVSKARAKGGKKNGVGRHKEREGERQIDRRELERRGKVNKVKRKKRDKDPTEQLGCRVSGGFGY